MFHITHPFLLCYSKLNLAAVILFEYRIIYNSYISLEKNLAIVANFNPCAIKSHVIAVIRFKEVCLLLYRCREAQNFAIFAAGTDLLCKQWISLTLLCFLSDWICYVK